MTLSPLDLLILMLATWRLAYLVSREAAPFNVMGRLRARLGAGASCVYCVSIWAGAGVLLLWHTPAAPLVWVLALSGGALMLAQWTGANHPP